MKLPVSAMIVGFNEAKLLPACFNSVLFCDDIHYTDLGSTDNSIKIAEQYANVIYHRAPVPSCEMIQTEVVHYVKNDWVIFIDPDEVIDPSLSAEIMRRFHELTLDENVGAIKVPWQFYFRKKKLSGTAWGGNNQKYLLVNRHRFTFAPVVHTGRRLNEGFLCTVIQLNEYGTNVLHHYWMNSFRIFLKKHRRYLKTEGIDRYNAGYRTSPKQIALTPYREFKKCFWLLKGYKDGFWGLCLSLFWAWYEYRAQSSLYIIQKKQHRR